MIRAPTQPVAAEHSGSLLVPPVEQHAVAMARAINGNPMVKLLAAAVVTLCSLLITVGVAYTSLKVSLIDSRLDTQDSVNAAQAADIQEWKIWRASHQAESQGSLEAYEAYKQMLSKTDEHNGKIVVLLGQLVDLLESQNKRRR